MSDALIDDLLDAHVPPLEQLPDWEEVRRRARRGRGRHAAVAAVVAVAALGGGPALGVVLLQSSPPGLPKGADASAALAVLQPHTGRVILEAAPWKGHDGICYLIERRTSGCTTRSRHGSGFFADPPAGYTFDPRVASVAAVLTGGRAIALDVHRVGGNLQVTFFTSPSGVARAFILRDARGVVLSRVRLP